MFLREVFTREKKKVNYLPVLRCRLASPGWAGSSREKKVKGEGKRENGKSQIRLK